MFSRRFEGGFYLVIALTEVTSLDLGASGPCLLLPVFLLSLCWMAFWFKANGPAMIAQERSSLLEGVATHVEWPYAALILVLLEFANCGTDCL